ncbi:MAG: glycosyltransferase family 2 protein [Acidobacteria bacterium]|nr:glycosyltransferase family 2 protein [Acidobacteriota bacterium]MCA1651269.1 glycosyltransferase family 2 protein [Acidobacteriota bacterium]
MKTTAVGEPGAAGAVIPARATVSYIVLSFNSARYIEKCVRSLTAARSDGRHDEIWVVDNGSIDDSPRILQALETEFRNLRVVRLMRNQGTTVSRNIALRQASGRFIAVVDSDVEVPAGAVDALLRTLEQNASCGIVAPRLEFPDGRLQLSTDVFPTAQHKLRRFVMLRRMEQQLVPESTSGPRPVDCAISAFWLMPRHVLDDVGLLDERIFYSPEDVDFCLRVWLSGYTILYDPRVRAVHDAQEISRTWLPRRAAFSHAAGLLYLFWKHRYFLGRRSLYRRIQAANGPGRRHARSAIEGAALRHR